MLPQEYPTHKDSSRIKPYNNRYEALNDSDLYQEKEEQPFKPEKQTFDFSQQVDLTV